MDVANLLSTWNTNVICIGSFTLVQAVVSIIMCGLMWKYANDIEDQGAPKTESSRWPEKEPHEQC